MVGRSALKRFTLNRPSSKRQRHGLGAPSFDSRAGFTLLELLVAITLLGLVMVLVLGGVRFGARAWQVGQASSDQIAESEATRTFLRARLEASSPSFHFDAGGNDRPSLQGDPDQLRFVTRMPLHLGGGVYVLELKAADSGQGMAFVVTRQPARLSPDDPVEDDDPLPTILMSDVRSVRFSYFGGDQTEEFAWRPAWEGSAGRPTLVRIDVEFGERDRRSWPPLIVALKIDE